MASGAGSSMVIEKLKGMDNYSTWKFHMKMLLIHEDLWDCVDILHGEIEDKKRQQKALARIALGVQPAAIPHIRNATTAHEAWNNLQKAYEDKGLCRRLGLLRSLFGVKLNECESMEAYVNKVTEISQQLTEIGSGLDDDFIAIVMLSGLTTDYDPLIMALENSNVKLSSDVVKGKLLQENLRRDDSNGGSAAALTVKRLFKCFRCKKPNHIARNCPMKRTEDGQRKAAGSKGQALVTALSVKLQSEVWCVDSGCTNHMCNDKSIMIDFVSTSRIEVSVANGEKLFASGYGHVNVKMKDCVKRIENVFYVPGLATNLLSVSAMTRKGFKIVFNNSLCKILYNNSIVATATENNGIYKLDTLFCKENLCNVASDNAIVIPLGRHRESFVACSQTENQSSMKTDDAALAAIPKAGGVDLSTQGMSPASQVSQEIWHRRLGHLNSRSMKQMKQGMVTGITYNDCNYKTCVTCIEGKQTKIPFPSKSYSRAKEVLGLIHTDLCGPMQESSFSGAKYFMTIIDDFSRKTFVYFLRNKNEAFQCFKDFKVLAENQTCKKIKVLRSDGGGEYLNKSFQLFLRECGIQHQTTVPHSPQQNGVAERANRTIIEKARCMLAEAGLDKRYWAEAVNTAVYLKNRSPTKAVMGATPEEKWSNKKVNVSHLRIFGCQAYNLIQNCKKLDKRCNKLIFVGYCEDSKGYRLIDPLNPTRIVKARNVRFIEENFQNNSSYDENCQEQQRVVVTPQGDLDSKSSKSSDNHEESSGSDDGSVMLTGDYSQRNKHRRETIFEFNDSDPNVSETFLDTDNSSDPTYIPGSSTLEMTEFDDCHSDSSEYANLSCARQSTGSDEPSNVHEAMNGREAEQWKKAMADEYQSFYKNKCWTLVERPKDQKAVQCKWVFKKKKGLNGEVLRYKARLVAKGYTQKFGIDYHETFSPVVRYSTIRMLLALAAEYNMDIDQMDVTTAFLNGDLQENVLMEQPEGFKIKGKEHMVYKLNKAIYGLKQAAKSWYEKINSTLTQRLNFKKLSSEPCVYVKRIKGNLMILTLYVDDILIFSSCSDEDKNHVKQELMKEFEMKDFGPVNHILGMHIQRQDGIISVDQSSYIKNVLKNFNMENCKPVKTPMETGLKLDKIKGESGQFDYRNLIGCLMYIAVCTRPDVAHVVSVLSQFNDCYGEVHWKAAKRVLRYLKGTLNYCLIFKKSGLKITSYVDADWAGNTVDRRSYTGYVFKIGSNVVSWESRKQRTVALSSTEAEYMALSDACKESLFMCNFLTECLDVKNIDIVMYNDSQSAQKLCTNAVFHSRTKHIDVRHHFIRQVISNGVISIKYCPTDDMIADVLTKALCTAKFARFVNCLSLEEC